MVVIHATQHIGLRNDIADQPIVSMTIGPTNRVTLLSNAGNALSPRYRCSIIDHAGTVSIDIAEKHHVSWCHELPANRVLYGSARGSLALPNGHIIHASGRHERDIFLGDGIASLQVAPAGIIWVGYFDEGLFGNRG